MLRDGDLVKLAAERETGSAAFKKANNLRFNKMLIMLLWKLIKAKNNNSTKSDYDLICFYSVVYFKL